MRLPCESVVTAVLPTLRSLVAKKLTEYHSFTQEEAAQKLGTTQAAVSHYLKQKRGSQLTHMLESVPEVRSAVLDVAANMATEKPSLIHIMNMICSLCETLRRTDIMCTLHRDSMQLPENCEICRK